MELALIALAGIAVLGSLALAGFVCWRGTRRSPDVFSMTMLQDMITWATTPSQTTVRPSDFPPAERDPVSDAVDVLAPLPEEEVVEDF